MLRVAGYSGIVDYEPPNRVTERAGTPLEGSSKRSPITADVASAPHSAAADVAAESRLAVLSAPRNMEPARFRHRSAVAMGRGASCA